MSQKREGHGQGREVAQWAARRRRSDGAESRGGGEGDGAAVHRGVQPRILREVDS